MRILVELVAIPLVPTAVGLLREPTAAKTTEEPVDGRGFGELTPSHVTFRSLSESLVVSPSLALIPGFCLIYL